MLTLRSIVIVALVWTRIVPWLETYTFPEEAKSLVIQIMHGWYMASLCRIYGTMGLLEVYCLVLSIKKVHWC